MAQRLAAMALRVEAEILVELLQAGARSTGTSSGGTRQRLAGPQAGVDADAGDLAAFRGAERRRGRAERGGGRSTCARPWPSAARRRPVRNSASRRAQPPSSVGAPGMLKMPSASVGCLVRPLDLVAEQGHRAVGEPVEQRRAFGIARSPAASSRICACSFVPVADRERGRRSRTRLQVGDQLLAAAGVGAVELDDTSSIRGGSCRRTAARPPAASPSSSRVDADDRVEQAMDGQLARRRSHWRPNRPGTACRR